VLAETLDPQIAAREAGLRYLDARGPGITRRKRGRHFAYFDAAGKPVRDEAELRRIRSVAVPPAYTGRDARGRRQYRYHKRFREVRDEAKYHRLVAFGRALPAIRKAVATDLRGTELSRRKVLAALVSLLDVTGVRVGNEEYAAANGSFGLTTLRTRHVRVDGSRVRLRFRGKTGKEHRILLDDARLARIIKRCRDLPGEELFTYLDETGSANSVSSEDVNEYLREIAGGDFSAKDFRTWIGTVECIGALAEPAAELGEAKKNIAAALERVAARLGNTPAICRKAYVHPAVLETYRLHRRLPSIGAHAGAKCRPNTLSDQERFTLRFVQGWERKSEPLDLTLKHALKAARRQAASKIKRSLQHDIERDVHGVPDCRIQPRSEHPKRMTVDLRLRAILGMQRIATRGDVEPLGLRNAVYREIAVHLERGRAVWNDPRARKGPSREHRGIKEVGRFERPIAVRLAGCDARRVEYGVGALWNQGTREQRHTAAQDGNGSGNAFDPNVRHAKLRPRFGRIDLARTGSRGKQRARESEGSERRDALSTQC
jgi:DNA topoisomerase-1